jgi:hypothetical protein
MKGFLKLVGALLVVAILILGGAYAAMSVPKKVDVTWSEKDLLSYEKKAGLVIKGGDGKGASLEDLLSSNFRSTGSLKVNDTFTSAEATAMVNSVIRGNGIVKDIKLNFRPDGTMEASATISSSIVDIVKSSSDGQKYASLAQLVAGKPVYWHYTVSRVNDKKFDGKTLEIYVGQVPIPVDSLAGPLVSGGSALNNIIARLDGFSCQALKIDAQGFHFNGTIPKNLEWINRVNALNK